MPPLHRRGGASGTTMIEALWTCYLESGADPSSYTTETRTERGRAAGLLAFSRDPNAAAATVDAVRQLRQDCDDTDRELLRAVGVIK
jgi:hypothetical protein